MNKKNGNIEFMRFIFSLIIILFHTGVRFIPEFNKSFPTFFSNGRIGVEFFFIVSGYLMMNSLSKVDTKLPIHKNTQFFILKKVLGIFPYHIPAFLITEVIYFALKHLTFKKGIIVFFKFFPNFFFAIDIGLPEKKLIAGEWYISAMLIAMFILTPFVLKYQKNFSRIFCPVFSLLMIGFIIQKSGLLGAPSTFILDESVSKGLLRAFAEICMGIFVYEVVQKIKTVELSKGSKLIYTCVEFSCYAVAIFYTFSGAGFKYDSYIAFTMAVAVAITFSGQSYFDNIINPKLASILGKISLPIYLIQYAPYIIVRELMPDVRFRYQFAFIMVFVFAMTPIIIWLGNKIRKRMIATLNKYSLL